MKKEMGIIEDDLPMLMPGEEMMMTEDEICFRFKRNGCRKSHIRILAELNAVETRVIEEILSSKGLIKAREAKIQ